MKNYFLTICALLLLSSPALAQLTYFGYVGGADDDQALGQTKGFTNFAHLSAGVDVRDPFIKNRVSAMAPLGVKAVIDLGKVLWCDYDSSNRYLWICADWAQRWKDWKDFNISILTPDKVIAFAIRDEPFNYNVNMNDFEQAAARVKSDLPWVKLLMTEAACVVARDDCGFFPGLAAVSRYGGTLPNIDWIGLDVYQIWPKTDTTFQNARDIFRLKFPGKKWFYVMGGYWDPPQHMPVFGNETTMQASPGCRTAGVASPGRRLPRPLPRSGRFHPGPCRKTPPRSLPLNVPFSYPVVSITENKPHGCNAAANQSRVRRVYYQFTGPLRMVSKVNVSA